MIGRRLLLSRPLSTRRGEGERGRSHYKKDGYRVDSSTEEREAERRSGRKSRTFNIKNRPDLLIYRKQTCIFCTPQKKVIRSPGFSPARQHPATSTNKCQEKDNTSAITHSRSGAERSDKQRTNEEEETHRLRSAVAFSMHTLCARGTMKPEINAAVGFLSRFLRVKGHVNDRQVQTFNQSLQDILAGTYKTKTKNPHKRYKPGAHRQ